MKRIEKIGLTAGLLMALGFNLSMNPELTHIARYERGQEFLSLDLASNLPSETVDLSQFNNDIKMSLKITDIGNGKVALQPIRNKTSSDTEGSGECTVCNVSSQSVNSGFSIKNVSDLNDVALQFTIKNQANLIKESKAKAKKEEVASEVEAGSSVLSACDKKRKDDQLSCQMNLYKKIADKCQKLHKKDDSTECENQLDEVFTPIQRAFEKCAPKSNRRIDITKLDEIGIDCDGLDEFARTDVVGNSTLQTHIKVALNFAKRKEQMALSEAYNEALEKGYKPFQISGALRNQLIGQFGMRIIQNPMTGRMEIAGIPYGDNPSADMLMSLQSNPIYTDVDESKLNRLFQSGYYNNFRELGAQVFSNAAGTNLDQYFHKTFSDIGSADVDSVPANLFQLRQRQGGGSVIAPQVPNFTNGQRPSYLNNTGATNSGTRFSPGSFVVNPGNAPGVVIQSTGSPISGPQVFSGQRVW